MKEKGFAGIILLIAGTLAAVLLYIAFTKKSNLNEPNNSTTFDTSEDNSSTPYNSPTPQTSPNTQITPPITNKAVEATTVPIQYTISPTRSYSNTSYPTSAPLSTATPVPTGKGKNGGGGSGGTGIVTGG